MEGREDLYEAVTKEVAEAARIYGIEVVDIKVKRLDLPKDNESAVYQRMISERNQQAEKVSGGRAVSGLAYPQRCG